MYYVRWTHLPQFLFGVSVFLEEKTASEMPEFIPAARWREEERGGARERERMRAVHMYMYVLYIGKWKDGQSNRKEQFNSPISLPKSWCSGCCDNMHSIRTPLEVGGVTSLTYQTHRHIHVHVNTFTCTHAHVHVHIHANTQ